MRMQDNSIPPVSVIVVVNDTHMDWIENGMNELFSQDHPNYEVIAVNDCGGENVSIALQKLYIDNPIMRYTSIQPDRKFLHTRKVALLVGIKCARFDNFIFIEPWTKPSSNRWLRHMAEGFRNNKQIVLGTSTLETGKKSVSRFIRSFALMSQIRSLRAAMAGRPYKTSRTNFGFTRKLFYENGGYNFLQSSYGENDLFLQKVAKNDNFSIVATPESQMIRNVDGSFGNWLNNEKFTSSTFRFYPFRVKIPVFIELFTSFLLWMIVLIAMVKSIVLASSENITLFLGDPKNIFWWSAILILVLFRQLVMSIVVVWVSKNLYGKNALWGFLCYEKVAAVFESLLAMKRRFGEARKIW